MTATKHTYPYYLRIYMSVQDAGAHLYKHAREWAEKYSARPEKAEEYAKWYVEEYLEAERWEEHPKAARVWEQAA